MVIILSIKYRTCEKFGNILVHNVLDKLTGMHKDFDRISFHEPPSNNILIGTLGGVNEENTENESIFPNSLSLKFLLEEFQSEISFDLDFYLYYRVYPSYEEQFNQSIKNMSKKMRFSRIWKKKKIHITESFDKQNNIIYLTDLIKDQIEEIKNDGDLLLNDTLFEKSTVLYSEDSYNEFLSAEKRRERPDVSWDIKLIVKPEKFIQNDMECVMLDINLVNNTIIQSNEKENSIIFDASIFNPILKIHLSNNVFKKFDYLYDNDISYSADVRSLNCQGKYFSNDNSIVTRNYGIFDQKKFVPKNKLDGVDLSFNILATEEGILELEKIYSKMNDYLDKASPNDWGYEEFQDMKERFNKNITLLKNDKKVANSFYLMNETFKRNSIGSSYDSWRLFQIVFIVSQLSDIVLNEERNTCELLHVMTGGGKSETYFGLVVFTAFYDRISGKDFGISAVTKFPLRMLSVQQLQRISNIFIFAEQVRSDKKIGGHPFSIAYFVGGTQDSDFPSHNINFLLKIKKAKINNEKIKGQIIDKCPLCGGDVYLDIDDEKQLVVHKCESCDEGTFRLYFSDDEIYRTLPTFIISTVDKWAGISLNRRFRNLLGGNLDECPNGHGFIPRKDTCGFWINSDGKECKEKGDSVEKDFDTSPTLIIQDEMHLIKEGFGTIDSHFESLIENIKFENSNGIKFKNIVMTATVSGAEKQIMHLYHKKTRVFPPELRDSNNDTFFFEYSRDDEGNCINQRQIIGLKSSIQNFKLIFHILRYTSEFFLYIESDLDSFAEENGFVLNELKKIVMYYKKLLTYHNKKEAVHSISYSIDDYVNIYDNVYKVLTEPLTGELSLDDIKGIISRVENFYEDTSNEDKMLVVNSTNIVSHGVDIDDWNFMIFDGMPRSTSEYIQALSRVGRKFFGIVFVSFSPMRTRDLSFYQHFDEYHCMLDYKVENVPLSRWAKLGFKQTFTSIFNAAILNYLSNELNLQLYNTRSVLKVLDNEDNKDKLINFIKNAYISDSHMKGAQFFKNSVEEEVEKRITQLENYADVKFFPNALKRSPDKYFKTQYGMRGLQDEILLAPHEVDDHFRTVYKGD